jgi:hypothetical protein
MPAEREPHTDHPEFVVRWDLKRNSLDLRQGECHTGTG